jgi:HAD superfamily hydrolase (TIGR01490 family)
MQRIAFYDLDKTITRRATFGPLIFHVIRHYSPGRAVLVPLMAIFGVAYLLGLTSRTRLKERNLALLVGLRPRVDHLRDIGSSFAHETLDQNILSAALAQIAEDQHAGYRIVIASASYRFYVEAIAKELGVTDVVATDLHRSGAAHYRSAIAGKNCYGRQKLAMVKEWLTYEGLDRRLCHLRFYSDHVSDLPCLEWANEAFATNAHEALKMQAAQRGWPAIDWLSKS